MRQRDNETIHQPSKRRKRMNKRPLFVALSNQKGGVGKSTMAVLLAG